MVPQVLPGSNKKSHQTTKQKQSGLKHEAYFSYGLLYIIAKQGDTFDSLAEEFDMRASKLAKYNDAPVDFPIEKGDVDLSGEKSTHAPSPNIHST